MAAFPALPAVAYMYLSLLVGIVPTSILLVLFAGGLRRFSLAAAGVGIGLLGFLSPLFPIFALEAAGLDQRPVILVTRLLSVALGFWAYKLAQPHVRGHLQLEGRLIPLIWAIGPGFAAVLLLPGAAVVGLLAPVLLFLSWAAG